jgi:hypothetical protein
LVTWEMLMSAKPKTFSDLWALTHYASEWWKMRLADLRGLPLSTSETRMRLKLLANKMARPPQWVAAVWGLTQRTNVQADEVLIIKRFT